MSTQAQPPYGSRECERITELLSWHANDTLSAGDRDIVEAHTAACEACRTTLAIERRIVGSIRSPRDNVEPSHHAGWQKLAARLDHPGARPVVPAPEVAPAPVRRRRLNWFATLGAAVAVQAAVIAVMAVALVRYQQSEAPRFHTVTNGDPTLAAADSGQLVRVVFDSTVDESEAREVAAGLAGRILAGPSPENVYTFDLAASAASEPNLENKVSGLRRQAHVLLVEPVVLGTRSSAK